MASHQKHFSHQHNSHHIDHNAMHLVGGGGGTDFPNKNLNNNTVITTKADKGNSIIIILKQSFILPEDNVVLTACNIHFYFTVQRGSATLKQLIIA
jgi:hypothetical protein